MAERKKYVEPSDYFPKDVLKKYPPKGGQTTKKAETKKNTKKTK